MTKRKTNPSEARLLERWEFTIDELSEDARERAIEQWRNENPEYPDYEWCDCVIDEWTKKLEGMGFYNIKIYFSGFWSQGDGACFDADVEAKELFVHLGHGDQLDAWDAIAKLDLEFEVPEFSFSIETVNTRYSHHNTRDLYFEIENDMSEDNVDIISDWAKEAEDLRTDLCHEIYRDLEKEYESLISDESIAEEISARGIMFDEEGNQI